MGLFNSIISRIVTKTPYTLGFRTLQEIRLKSMGPLRSWKRIEYNIDKWGTQYHARKWKKSYSNLSLSKDGAIALTAAVDRSLINKTKYVNIGDSILKKGVPIFGTRVSSFGCFPWNEEQKYGHKWKRNYFKNYKHSERREQPYDVKFVWELSRLSFLPALAQADILAREEFRTRRAIQLLEDWERENPLAYSVNWYPMEAAMRGIQLCIFADMVKLGGGDHDLRVLLRLLAKQGEFISRTIEISNNPGNHFTAQLTALLLIGISLSGIYPNSYLWVQLAKKWINQEITKQFLPDGVNHEKSTSYHRLNLDLFLLSAMAIERTGNRLSGLQYARLKSASYYNSSFIRPDGRSPLIGDNDDAVLFGFEDNDPRDHSTSIAFAAEYFNDDFLRKSSGYLPAAVIWFFGTKSLNNWNKYSSQLNPKEKTTFFPYGGVLTSKRNGNYLFVDVGEVGQKGQGGHGHNDMLSFELSINGNPLIVDPGTFLYSGCPKLSNILRSTKAHNCLTVDNLEIAPILGKFKISNIAKPKNIVFIKTKEFINIRGGHTGYIRLKDPVVHYRSISFNTKSGSFVCKDRIYSSGKHYICRYFHFDQEIYPHMIGDRCVVLRLSNCSIIVNWDKRSRAEIIDGYVCPGYGQLVKSKVLVLKTEIEGKTALEIRLEQENGY